MGLRSRPLQLGVCLLLAWGIGATPASAAPASHPPATTGARTSPPTAPCRFELGFLTLSSEIPAVVGSCRDAEAHDPATGDAVQHTARGLLVWRKSDNWTAFTDGYATWIDGPYGLARRLNSQRFLWEANPEGFPVVPDSAAAPPSPLSPALQGELAGIQPMTPTSLRIPSIGVVASAEQVGTGANGAVGVPSTWNRVAWYDQGYRPGAAGNAVIIGHLDSTTGPAIFWRVAALLPGSRIEIGNGSRTLTFVVTEVDRYPANQAPLWRIFGPAYVPHLNLITCAGDWDPHVHRYDQRTVVYAVLDGFRGVQATPPAVQTFPDAGGYTIADDAEASFLTEFYRLGGIAALGYPISQRFVISGSVLQAFQKAVLKWQPDIGTAVPINVLDWLHDVGDDAWLAHQQLIPAASDWSADAGLPWDAVVARHQAVLSANLALQRAYFAAGDPLAQYGLPTSPVVDEGPVIAVRCQRAVLQVWKQNEPWANAGQVTLVNVGDLARSAGLLPAESLVAPSP